MRRVCFAVCLCVFSLCFVQVDISEAASKGGWLRMFLRHGDEAAAFGKQAGKKLSQAEKLDLQKMYPALRNKSDDILASAKIMDDFAKGGVKQTQLINAVNNPVTLLKMEKRAPGAWKSVDDAATVFATTKTIDASVLKALPTAQAAQAKRLFGNYAVSADTYLEMARKGGRGAVAVTKKLITFIRNNPKSSFAVSLLAWHMLDPKGAEAAIEDFFAGAGEVAGNIVTSATEGFVGSVANTTMTSVDNTTTRVLDKFTQIPLSAKIVIICIPLLLFSPTRRTILLLVGLPFKMLNKKLEGMQTAPREEGTQSEPSKQRVSIKTKPVPQGNKKAFSKFKSALRGGNK